MLIERQNILELIGKNKSKYSDCIICSYTFDFTFFEERVLPALRHSFIRNINIFIDGHYMDQKMEDSSAEAFRHHRSYSLNPVYLDGIFHPKIMMLTGPKHGLLIIGSGNLTSSGISTNDEVWGAFHLNSIESTNAPIFSEVWHYLELLFNETNGFNKQKLSWIYNKALWIQELSGLRSRDYIKLNDDVHIAFIANENNQSISDRLKTLLPKGTLNELNIISPYFDKKAQAIDDLKAYFNPEVFNIITDSEFGLLPTEISDNLNDAINFYDWKNCLANFDKRLNRLHAKLFQFVFDNGTEYLMIGSANATVAAIGTNNQKPLNAEAGIVLRRQFKEGYISELGIEIDKSKPIEVKSKVQSTHISGDSLTKRTIKYTIIHAEINGPKLSFVLRKELENDSQLILFNQNGEQIDTINITSGQLKFSIENIQSDQLASIAIASKSKIISNRALVHNVDILAKSNTDPHQIELNNIMSALEANPDGDQYIELLKYADYNWVEAEIDNNTSKKQPVQNANRQVSSEKSHQSITHDTFNSLQSVQQLELKILSDPTTQIADILHVVSKGLNINTEELKDSSEESLITEPEEDRTGEGEAVNAIGFVRIRGKRIEEAIHRHLQKVHKYYIARLNRLKQNKIFQDCPRVAITIKDCSHISIAIDLMYIFQGKTYISYFTEFALQYSKSNANDLHKLEKKYALTRTEKTSKEFINAVYYEINQDNFQELKTEAVNIDQHLLLKQEEYNTFEYKKTFLKEGAYSQMGRFGIKNELIEGLGSFLISANQKAGFKQYDYEVLNDKLSSMRKSLFEKSTFLINNIHWNDNEYIYKKLLLINLLHFVYQPIVKTIDIQHINDSLSDQYQKSKGKSTDFEANIEYYYDKILPKYMDWLLKYQGNKNELLVEVNKLKFGDIVYNMKIGFSSVLNYSNEQLHITSPGLDWNELTKSPSIKIKYTQSKIIRF